MWRGTGMLILEFAVALINHTAIFAVGVPYLGTELLSAITTENSTGKGTLRCGAPCGFLPSAKLSLHHIPRFCINDGGVAVFHILERKY